MANKILVVYYSRTGITKRVVDKLSSILDCDIEVITDNEKRKGIIGYLKCGYEASFKKDTNINPTKYCPKDYEIVIIASPTWAGTMASLIRTYLMQNKGKFNKVAFISTQGGSNGDIFNHLEELTSNPIVTLSIDSKDVVDESYLLLIGGFIEAINHEFKN